MNTYYNIPKSPYDIRDYTITAGSTFPNTFSLDILPPIKNQWLQSTCVAHALSSAVEYHHQRQHGFYAQFSTEFIYGLRENGAYVGDGMFVRSGLDTLVKYGDVYEEDCKGNHNYKKAMENVSKNVGHLKELAYPHRISGYFKIKTNDELKTALMNHGVVVAGMKVYDGHKLVNDVYTYNPSRDYGAHCIFIYGWNEKGWLVQNSWGKFYGWDGRFIIPFDFQFNEIWGITDNITDGNIIKPKKNKWLNVVYKIINKIVNIFKR
jgi:hypothetical protein